MTSESTAPTPDAASPDQAAPAPSSSRGTVALLLVVLAAAGAVASFPLWRDKLGLATPEPGFELENLRAELSAASARLAQLEARPATADESRLAALEQALKSAPATGATPTAEIESLAKQVAELKRSAADAAALLRLADRIEQTEAGLRELQAKRASAAALLLAVGQLREAVNLGLGFDAELRTVKILSGEDAALGRALDSIKDKAAAGIATRASLNARFETLAPAIIRAELLPEGEGWVRRMLDKLLSLVTIRREDGGAAGVFAAAVIGRTQAALNRADLATAIAELQLLSAGPAETAAPWLAEAQARLAADRAVSELSAQVLALGGVKP